MKHLFIISQLLFLYSCCNKPESTIRIWNYDDFIKRNVKMSDLADEMTIIQPDSIDYKGARIVHASSFFLAGTEQGILRYDKEGHFMNRIGAIGQGPGEYGRFYQMAINETERIIYVYRIIGCKNNKTTWILGGFARKLHLFWPDSVSTGIFSLPLHQ